MNRSLPRSACKRGEVGHPLKRTPPDDGVKDRRFRQERIDHSAAFFIAVKSSKWSSSDVASKKSLRFHLRQYLHLVCEPWRKEVEVEVAVAGVEQEAQEGLAVERAEQPEPLAAATTQLNPPEARAIRLAILLPNLPAARGKIASIPQGRELGLGTPVPASADRAARAVRPDSVKPFRPDGRPLVGPSPLYGLVEMKSAQPTPATIRQIERTTSWSPARTSSQ